MLAFRFMKGQLMLKDFQPMLFRSLRGYTKKQLASDVISGIIVAIIALPLSIALAIASGVGAQEGLYTAIVAGFLISFFGGSTVQISGPTAAFATIVAGIVASKGMSGLMLATIMAGILLVLMGLFRLGSLIKYIPYTITTGFTAGIAVTILVGQLKDFFGLTYREGISPIETVEKLEAFFGHLPTVNGYAILVGAISLLILVVWPKIKYVNKVPASMIAVIVGILCVSVFHLPVNTISGVSGGFPAFRLPEFSFKLAKEVLPDAFTIAMLAAIESLLSAVVADGMTNTRHNSNTELVAQGIGNLGSALFGGIPATGAIARTAANVKNGGRTPIAGMVHAVVLLLVLLLLMPYASLIPMPVIAAILFVVAYNMCQWRPFVRLIKTAPASDIFVLVLTFVLTVVFDLVVAIVVGLVLACIFFMKRMGDETSVRSWMKPEEKPQDATRLLPVPKGVSVYDITGPLFFGVTDRIATIGTSLDLTRCIILRMKGVPAIDATAINALLDLYERCSDAGIALILSHVNEQPLAAMKRSGFAQKIGEDRICSHIDDALSLACILVSEETDPS